MAEDPETGPPTAPKRESNQQRLRGAFWPDISDALSARDAALYGVWAAAVTVVIMVVRLALGGFVLPAEYGVVGLLIEMLAFTACGGAIWYSNSRIAAVGGLLLFAVQKYLQLAAGIEPNFGTVLLWLGIGVLWISAIRGTSWLHRTGRRSDTG